MKGYILRRVLWGVLLLVLVSALTFVLFRILPTANPARLRAGRNASPRVIAEITANLGLNKPLLTQFWLYMKGLFLHFDLGYSYYSGASVRSLLFNRLPATLSLTIGAALLWMAIALPVGIISALRRRSHLDRASMGVALVLISAPEYWLGLIVLYLFAADIGQIKLFPGAGSYAGLTSDPWKWFTSMILPWLVLASGFAAIYARVIRGSLIETMGEDYIRTARAKGLSERRVVLRHGLRAAITPILTIFALERRRAAGRRGAGRDGVRHPRHRPPELRRDHPRRLPDHPRHGPARRTVHHHREHRRQHRLCLSRPEGPLRMSAHDQLLERPTRPRGATGEPLLAVRDLRVSFPTEDGLVQALDGVSLQIEPAGTLGIVGESGSGKTVAALSVLGLTRAEGAQVSGQILFGGRDLLELEDEALRQVRGNEIAMVFQDPLSSLHPLYRVGAQIVEAIRAHQRVSKAAARARAIELLGMVEIPDPARRVERLPARAVRRHAPACDDRDGALQRAQAADRRRADDRARTSPCRRRSWRS